jgi:sortase A
MIINTSKQFKIVFLVRFFGYLLFFLGFLSLVAILGPLIQAEFSYRVDNLLGIRKVLPKIITSGQQASPIPGQSSPIPNASGEIAVSDSAPSPRNDGQAGFGSISASSNTIVPVSTEFGIVIEKIDANAKIIANVDPANEKQYVDALSKGVAEALGSTAPGQPGNLYLFSHSTDAPWNIVRYNAIFYLLRELDPGDRVIIFYQNRRFDYIVYDKQIVDPSDVSFLTDKYNKPVLTLQTCDPPGTLFHRLIIRAKLENS